MNEHGNRKAQKGNQNARSDDPAIAKLHLRLRPRQKAAYVKQAAREGKKLTQWALDKLDAAVAEDIGTD